MKKVVFIFASLLVFLVGCSNSSNADNRLYSDVYKSVSEALTESSSSKLLNEYDGEYTEAINYNEVKATNALVYYIHLLYLNETFPTTTKPIKFIGNYVKNGEVIQYNEITMLTKIDKDNNKLYCDAYGDSHMHNNDSSFFYLNVDINYDFVNNKLISFDSYMLGVVSEELDESFVIFSKYKDNKLYEFNGNSSSKKELVSYVSKELWKPYMKQLSSCVEVKETYDDEYIKATDYIFGEGYFE